MLFSEGSGHITLDFAKAEQSELRVPWRRKLPALRVLSLFNSLHHCLLKLKWLPCAIWNAIYIFHFKFFLLLKCSTFLCFIYFWSVWHQYPREPRHLHQPAWFSQSFWHSYSWLLFRANAWQLSGQRTCLGILNLQVETDGCLLSEEILNP